LDLIRRFVTVRFTQVCAPGRSIETIRAHSCCVLLQGLLQQQKVRLFSFLDPYE